MKKVDHELRYLFYADEQGSQYTEWFESLEEYQTRLKELRKQKEKSFQKRSSMTEITEHGTKTYYLNWLDEDGKHHEEFSSYGEYQERMKELREQSEQAMKNRSFAERIDLLERRLRRETHISLNRSEEELIGQLETLFYLWTRELYCSEDDWCCGMTDGVHYPVIVKDRLELLRIIGYIKANNLSYEDLEYLQERI